MNMKIMQMLLLACLVFALGSCHSDNGNYDYKDVNEITVDLGSMKYTFVVGNTARIEPVLTFSMGEIPESELEYNWTLNGETVSEEPVLEYVASKIATNVECQLRVTNPANGLTYIGRTVLDFTQRYNSLGWLALSRDEEASYLNFMTGGIASETYEPHLKVYQEQNQGTRLPKETIGFLEHFFSMGSSSKPSSLWVTAPNASQCIDLEGAAWSKDVTLPETFLEPGFAETLTVKQIAELKWMTVVVAQDGKVYTRKKLSERSFHTGKFLSEPLTYEGKEITAEKFLMFPEMRTLCMPFIEGEKGSQRMLALLDYNKAAAGKIVPFTVNEQQYTKAGFSESHPRLNDFKDTEVTYLGYARESSSLTNGKYVIILILKKADGSGYYYQEYKGEKATASSASATPMKSVELPADFFGDASVIYAVPYLTNGSRLLVAKGTKLYYIDRLTIGTGELRPLNRNFEFDAKVTALDAESSNSHFLGVGLANGKFFVLSLKGTEVDNLLGKALGDETKKEEERFYQLDGEVFAIRYRYRSANGWT